MNAELTDDQIGELQQTLDARGRIAAVKLCREWTGCSLREAKHRVEALGTGEREYSDGLASNLDEQVMDEILDAMEQGNKLEAVKLYKESTGVSLVESKQFVELLMGELGIEQSSGSGCAGVVLAIVAAAGAASTLA
jgi:ribosomal protein L7/L12